MTDWRERLGRIIRHAGDDNTESMADVDASRREIEQFLRETVVPAFEEIITELRRHGRDARVELQPMVAVLHITRNDEVEFTYAVRGSVYHRLSFAFPVLRDDDNIRIARAEIVRPGGISDEYRLREFTRQGIINDFLEAYDQWLSSGS